MRTCSEFHRERGSLLPGSAPECRRWIFLQRPRPWPAKVKPTELGERLDRLGARFLFSHGDGDLVRAIERRGRETRGGRFASLEAAVDFLEGDLVGEQPELFAVCTHGTRDPCCGKLGPGVAAALAREGAEVIEVSHPGGHRFAPTVLAFPEFRCYGCLRPENVPGFLARQRAGELQKEHYRGALHLGRTAQAAEAAVWERCGQAPGWSKVHWDQISRVHLETERGMWVVELEEVRFRGPVSCNEEDDDLREYRPLSVEQS